MLSVVELQGLMLEAAIVSGVCSLLIVLTRRWHGAMSMDNDLRATQKMHMVPVPRVGGIAVFFGLAGAAAFAGSWNAVVGQIGLSTALAVMLVAATPVFLSGLVEDTTKSVPPRVRLLAAFASALLAGSLLEAWLPRVDVPLLDELMGFFPVTVLVTAVCVAGVTNAINIIDGFNGLAGVVVAIILAALAVLNWQLGDAMVAQLALVGVAGVLGFMTVNYPSGRIFLGDGGAYLLGFWVAQVAVLTVARNPDASTWQVLAICFYPVLEVLFTIYRRRAVRKTSSMLPDRLHFHTLLYRRVLCQKLPRVQGQTWLRNSAVALVMGCAVGAGAVASLEAGSNPTHALAIIGVEALLYLAAYTRLVRGHWCLRPDVLFGLRPERKLPQH
ncbi:MAG: hypothetical protein JWP36_990 [Paucimonas sp.]|nr:hypothetical protein [Paucimonas sp.]